MEKQEIIARAKEYIAKEKDAHFRGEVEELLAAGDGTLQGGERTAIEELEDRFYQNLEFGTGGLRGVIGGGFNRMNTFVVKSATQGLATYLIKAKPQKAKDGKLSAVIAFDSRHFSPEFAQACALIFAANGIKTYLFSSLRPTPELSFAIRRLNADTGIVVTASHNPPQYNGYKAYWDDGAQVIEPHDVGIIKEVNAVVEIKELDKKTALDKGLLKIIDSEIDEPFWDMIKSHLFRPNLIKEKAGEVKIVYTPLHGTGAMHVEKVLGDLGLKVITVPQQREGNGDFPTVAFPNPEEAAAMEMAIALGVKEKADVVMATDPDADRFGIAVPKDGKYILISGNQIGALLADYILLSLKELGKLPKNPAIVNSIVTTGMQAKVAALYGADCLECLTGFKWIADVMKRCEKGGDLNKTIVFGTEESYGYLIEDEVRDKDGVSAAALTAEMTLYWRSKGKSLLDRLEELYKDCGYWQEMGVSKYFKGSQGPAIMEGIMAEYRKSPPKTLGGIKVERFRDIKNSSVVYPGDPARKEKVLLPKSDVLQFILEDGTVVSARPSGTEPKIKFYASCVTNVTTTLSDAKKIAEEKLGKIKADIIKVIGE